MFLLLFPRGATLALLAVCCCFQLQGSAAQGNLRRVTIDESHIVPLVLHNATREHRADIEMRMRPIFASLPKSDSRETALGPRVARLALVRYFLLHEFWYIKGLAKPGAVWNEYPADSVYADRLPRLLLMFIERKLHAADLDLQALIDVVLGVETLVRRNAETIMEMAYLALKLPVEEPITDVGQARLVLKTFTAFLYQPSSQTEIGNKAVPEFLQELRAGDYFGQGFWEDIDTWVDDVLTAEIARNRNPFGFTADFRRMMTVAEDVDSSMGRFQSSECMAMKHTMMDMSDPSASTGRVPLANFYRPYNEGDRWDFTESARYLEFIGALDVNRRDQKSVMIPNYMSSWGNCLETSSFHQVCCVNECELLMMELEANLAAPYIDPKVLASHVSQLSSDSVVAPRNLSAPLTARLESIAARNGGKVPLHGRFFAEWMHRAFPNECPRPRDNRVKVPTEFTQEKQATVEEIQAILDQAKAAKEAEGAEEIDQENDESTISTEDPDNVELPWSEVEELLTDQNWEEMKATSEERSAASGGSASGRGWLRLAAAAAIVVAALVGILPHARSTLKSMGRAGFLPKQKKLLPD
mmetsp:Transcript_34184/g.72779  ORF Transcript_34184/g.72779 Transcript_34184/m.72779 type:complete len:586 (+) Transcript_34184:175-1932(+)|eukprot:CAMPEP_0206454168 /NCGR_PEP_ID=MMETSP0324_2-20121206/20980_1 /ASSEMBLY_ACC=CAM_ASM_000836 /TAXON_ID=2866 /ORGANISM="Crypthecodinium cohnii, Strain Seligo" /LENGTH=585 /DNA_ID=CAMNT_0053924597 /DNA_START=103 /DNA_END=1860 /DNA_ORIENTATION=-